VSKILAISLALLLLATWPRVLRSQPAEPNDGVHVGDLWVYDQTDDLTKTPINTYTSMVTDVSPKEITTSIIIRGNSGRAFVVFDHDWNRIVLNDIRFTPNDGQGIHAPLAVGKEWRSDYTSKNAQNGVAMKGSSLSKVVAQETVTTAAGTFDTFKIDRQLKEYNVADPSRFLDTEMFMWFSPQIDHWIRRSFVGKVESRVRSASTDELIKYLQKQ
jgi:hypothetical protein